MPTHLQVDDRAPGFALPDATRTTRALEDYRGQVVVLAFYPMDFSGVCTEEHACIVDVMGRFNDLDAQVLGVSVDHSAAHKAFAAHVGIEYPLLADFHPKAEVGKRYGVYLEDKGFHARTTFVIDPDGRIAFIQENDVPSLPDIDEIVAAARRAA